MLSSPLVMESSISPNEDVREAKTRPHQMRRYVHISDKVVPQRAIAVLPTVLQLRNGSISPRKLLSARVRFGPVEGVKKEINLEKAKELVSNICQSKIPLFLIKNKYGNCIHVDVSDKDKSSWLSLLPLGDQDTANVWLYEDDNELYVITTQPIEARKPLLLGYSKQYAADHGLSIDLPMLDIDADISNGVMKWWCYECECGLGSETIFQRHVQSYHTVEKRMLRRRYSCRHCSRKFSRLFTLKRHMQRSCFKKTINTDPPNTDIREHLTANSCSKEDSRIPSDESFNNYSNGLDFPTTLFDTDRIPGLDISSRSETDFNSFVMGYKDDCLGNDLELSRISGLPETHQDIERKPNTFNSIACQYCNKIIDKEAKSEHFRKCSRRRFECECGHVYNSKKKLIQHITTDHPSDNDTSTSKSFTTSYTCEKCQHKFKRRGMLVNHLWRVHNSVCTAVPLERRDRHYLCVECPKMYRTAAKRDRHIRLHHPGVDKVCARTIEGAVRVCEPAACSACPRQYATRAKLLQHMRLHHPQLVVSEVPRKSNTSEMEIPTSEETNRNRIALQQFLSIY